MSSLKEYVSNYGDLSFTQLPFSDADNVIMCKISYMPIEQAVSESFDDEPVPYSEAANKLFDIRGRVHKPLGLMIAKDVSEIFMQMSEKKRYSELKVVACKEVFSVSPAVQFAAATYISPDGTLIVTFRGTDDTFAGWREDIDILIKKGTPSHKMAVDYLNELGEKYEGKIIICGHSKGGNVALYGALNCKQEVRDRITAVYNNDGPGFWDYRYLYSKEYQELLPRYRHFVPDSSFIGMLLAHDDDYSVIKSTMHTGPFQHDLTTWKLQGDTLQASELTKLGKLNDLALMDILMKISEAQSEYADVVFSKVIEGLGQKDITGFAKNAVSSVKGGINAWKSIDEAAKDGFKGAFAGTGKILTDAFRTVKNDAVPTIKARAEKLLAAIQ